MKWSNDNDLILKVYETKDLIEDFRKCRNFKDSIIIISGIAVKQVNIHKCLCLTVMNALFWTQNADKIIKKGRQKLFFLRILRSYNVDINVMINFYCVVIEIFLATNILVWFGCTSKREIKKIKSIIRTAERIIGTSLCTIQSIYLEPTINRTSTITKDLSHPATRYFHYLPSGRLRAFKGNERLIDSFYPFVIKTFNTNFIR